ncbi:MAG: 4Fe-4S dicluster domain-containing protein [Ruminococcaceae bacterium]|nr:4Fe-4S dicluster domain-containing protein [Oscillospiraceae bacterium]
MITRSFKDKALSLLGFGAMRLPTLPDGSIDRAATQAMVDRAMAAGVNYYDTAYPYHGGMSEIVMGEVLSRYPRRSYYLATKYPGHQFAEEYHPDEVFEHQLKKCNTEYFDFYLLHNVYEKSMEVYCDEKWGIVDYFVEQKKQGRIRHLGFSTHGGVECIREFLDRYGEHMEFCQIQLNYLDWTLQKGDEKYRLLTERGIPVWVMEPVRGGKLAALSEKDTARLAAARPDDSAAAWGFRFLAGLPNVGVILSGMSNMEQLEDNIATFGDGGVLSEAETALLLELAEGMKVGVPCTACRYCCDGCPMGLDIPMLLALYNEILTAPSMNARMQLDALPEDKKASACVGCGACSAACPQNIDIPTQLAKLTEEAAKLPDWAEICRQRAEAARRMKG